MLKPYLHKSRSSFYWRFNLNGKKVMGHVLVADHFLPDPKPGQTQIEHADNNTLNNNAANLLRVSPSENIQFMYKKRKIPQWLTEYAVEYKNKKRK